MYLFTYLPITCHQLAAQKIRVLSSPRQNARLPYVTQNVLLTVAAFRPWRGSQCPAAQDPAPDEAMKIHELSESVRQWISKPVETVLLFYCLTINWRRGWDLNPRTSSVTSFPGPRTRPTMRPLHACCLQSCIIAGLRVSCKFWNG